jgi:hypothetical protein
VPAWGWRRGLGAGCTISTTGTFLIKGGTYLAKGSEAAVIEGLNSISVTDVSLTGTVKHGVMIYQSNSAGSAVTGTFTLASGGSLVQQS